MTRDGSFDRPCKCAGWKPCLDFRAVELFREISKKPFSQYRGAPWGPLISRFNFPIWMKFGYVVGLMGAEAGKIGKKIKKIPYPNHASAKIDFSAFSTFQTSSKRVVASSGPVTIPRSGALCFICFVKISCQSVHICRSYGRRPTPDFAVFSDFWTLMRGFVIKSAAERSVVPNGFFESLISGPETTDFVLRRLGSAGNSMERGTG